jgi:hypothetical protein
MYYKQLLRRVQNIPFLYLFKATYTQQLTLFSDKYDFQNSRLKLFSCFFIMCILFLNLNQVLSM